MRSLLTSAFKDKQNTANITTINRLIVQGRMELEETLMLWKGESHIQGYFDLLLSKEEEAQTQQSPSFLDDFYAGK